MGQLEGPFRRGALHWSRRELPPLSRDGLVGKPMRPCRAGGVFFAFTAACTVEGSQAIDGVVMLNASSMRSLFAQAPQGLNLAFSMCSSVLSRSA